VNVFAYDLHLDLLFADVRLRVHIAVVALGRFENNISSNAAVISASTSSDDKFGIRL
jgi:hypothetical protein